MRAIAHMAFWPGEQIIKKDCKPLVKKISPENVNKHKAQGEKDTEYEKKTCQRTFQS